MARYAGCAAVPVAGFRPPRSSISAMIFRTTSRVSRGPLVGRGRLITLRRFRTGPNQDGEVGEHGTTVSDCSLIPHILV